MSGKGMGIMGVGIGEGDRAVIEAAESAVNSPLLNEMSMTGARNILINIRGSESLGIHAIDEPTAPSQKQRIQMQTSSLD